MFKKGTQSFFVRPADGKPPMIDWLLILLTLAFIVVLVIKMQNIWLSP